MISLGSARAPAAGPAAAFAPVTSFQSYRQRDGLSEVVGAQIDATANTTVYGQHLDAVIRYPAAMGANRTVTLSNRSKASGLLSTVPPPIGTIVTVRRRAGTADAFTLTINNHDGAAITTITTAATSVRCRFDGTNWILLA